MTHLRKRPANPAAARTTRFRLGLWRGEKVRSGQTGVSSHQRATLRAERLGGERGGLLGAVGFTKEMETNAEAFEPVGRGEEIALAGNPAQDKMRMRLVGSQELAGGFHGRVNGLNRHLRGRQIPPHEDIQVRNLGEGGGHGFCPSLRASIR